MYITDGYEIRVNFLDCFFGISATKNNKAPGAHCSAPSHPDSYGARFARRRHTAAGVRSLEQAVALVQESSPNALFSAKAVLCEKAIGTDLEHTRNILFFHVPSLGTDWNRLGTHLEQTTFIVNTNHLGLLPDRLLYYYSRYGYPGAVPSRRNGEGWGGF